MILLVTFVFFVIIATLESENTLETDNRIVKTGATIVDSVKEQEFMEGVGETWEGIKETLSDLFS